LGSDGEWRKGSPELRRGVWPARVSTGRSEARLGRLYRRGGHGRGRGSDKRSGRARANASARASASARSDVWHSVEHEAAQREVVFKRGLAPNL
jgi:hypothetical protein